MRRAEETHTQETRPSTADLLLSEDFIQDTVSIRSSDAIIDQLFLIACALRCRSLPCTLRKIEKNPDLLTRHTTAYLKGLGYEDDDCGLTQGSLFRVLPHESDGLMKVAQIIRLPDGAQSPWGGVYAPTGSGYVAAQEDLCQAVDVARNKVSALAKALYVQVEFLRDNPKIGMEAQLIHDTIIHYEDAKDFVSLNPKLAHEMIQIFNVDSFSAGLMSAHIMTA